MQSGKLCSARGGGMRHELIIALAALFVITGTTSFASILNGLGPEDAPQPAYSETVTGLTLVAVPRINYVNDTVTFYANATSSTGANLTFKLYFDSRLPPSGANNTASPYEIINTASPGSAVFNHTYDHPGNFTDSTGMYFFAKVWCSDGVTTSREIKVYVNVNRAPVLAPGLPPISSTQYDYQPFNFSVGARDPDNDTLTAVWDFGDGTNATQILSNTTIGVWFNQTHIYTPPVPGMLIEQSYNYTLNLTVSDSFGHVVTTNTTVPVIVPRNYFPLAEQSTQSLVVAPLVPVNITASATDAEGDAITWTFIVTNGGGGADNVSIMVYHTEASAPNEVVWNNITYEFPYVGLFTMHLYVSDVALEYQGEEWFHNNTANALAFQVYVNRVPYVSPINANPDNPLINTSISNNISVVLSVDTNDEDGDIVNGTWDFGDGSPAAYNESAGGVMEMYHFAQVHIYNEAGTYNVTITVTDGHGNTYVSYRQLNVTSNNMPPTVIGFDHDPYTAGDFATPNETLKFNLKITDKEHDVIEIIWDFGDGTPLFYTNVTDYGEQDNVTITMNHTYTEFGNYTVTIWITDHKIGALTHEKNYSLPIRVWVKPPPVVHRWDWWDYTSLSMVLMIPVLMAVWFLHTRRRSKAIEQQGMSYDEWKLRKELEKDREKGREFE